MGSIINFCLFCHLASLGAGRNIYILTTIQYSVLKNVKQFALCSPENLDSELPILYISILLLSNCYDITNILIIQCQQQLKFSSWFSGCRYHLRLAKDKLESLKLQTKIFCDFKKTYLRPFYNGKDNDQHQFSIRLLN